MKLKKVGHFGSMLSQNKRGGARTPIESARMYNGASPYGQFFYFLVTSGFLSMRGIFKVRLASQRVFALGRR